jgi:hypothetical protein
MMAFPHQGSCGGEAKSIRAAGNEDISYTMLPCRRLPIARSAVPLLT